MKIKDQKLINNLKLRYQDYDRTATKYFYDIDYTLIQGSSANKIKRGTGSDEFDAHIRYLTENLDVADITVVDYTGKHPKAKILNPPVTIQFIDVKQDANTPVFLSGMQSRPSEPMPNPIMNGLAGLFAGTEYEALGSIAPIAKFLDDKHEIKNLNRIIEEQKERISELKQTYQEVLRKNETLQKDNEKLDDENFELETELENYRKKDHKQRSYIDLAGAALLSGAKMLVKNNPSILSGIIPPETLSGLFDEPQEQEPPVNGLSPEDQERLDDATVVFDWLQTLDTDRFEKVISIIALIRQNPEYINPIINFLNGNHS